MEYDFNDTIRTLLQRRTVRNFTREPISEQTRDLLERAAQQAPTSEYRHSWSAIRVTDRAVAERMAQIGGQSYIAEAALLYIFVVDVHRNTQIVLENGVPERDLTLKYPYSFFQGYQDAMLALSAMQIAAESLGLGVVTLGSVLNDVDATIEALKLPQFVYPVLGLGIGHVEKAPEVKPRMPQAAQFFDNRYPESVDWKALLKEFDEQTGKYVDLRHPDRTIPPFFNSITRHCTDRPTAEKRMIGPAERQGFVMQDFLDL